MAAPQTLEDLEKGEEYIKGIQQLKINTGITQFPASLLTLHTTLSHLDLSGNTHLSTLPRSISRLHNLKIAFFSNCSFHTFPDLSTCLSLEMVAFKSNSMTTIPENVFPPRLRWLILTGNQIASIPKSIGKCARLEKCMLAGNKLTALPEEMRECRRLGLLRVSCNLFEGLPGWVWELPELGFFSWAGNPCAESVGGKIHDVFGGGGKEEALEEIEWDDLIVNEVLGKGASGIISKGTWKKAIPNGTAVKGNSVDLRDAHSSSLGEEEVAIKIFHGTLTSDGSPQSEMQTCIAAGQQANLISPLGTITSHPDHSSGLVLELIPPQYINLGLPPNFDTCTRDNFAASIKGKLSLKIVQGILEGIAAAGEHLHARGVSHGDLYAHNILVDVRAGKALLGDFGAGTVYGGGVGGKGRAERLEVLAFGHLIEDMVRCVEWSGGEGEGVYLEGLMGLWRRCVDPLVEGRPGFKEVIDVLETLREEVAICN